RPGDVIQVDGELGTVEKLRIRSTLVRTLDNVELIIPNEKLLTSTVTSYTKSERLIRISLPVGVGYDSDPDEVHSVLLQTTKEHELIRSDPAPVVLFSGLGDSSLDFKLLVWIDEPSQMAKVRSDLYFLIFRAFAKHHIEIPYPQHDLNLRRGWEKLAAVVK
ncbi:MAG: mechanosensitive ion channel family protein, partial [Ardenticatenaceae bacterium]